MYEKAASHWSYFLPRNPDKIWNEKRFFDCAPYFFSLNDAKETTAWKLGGINAKKQ